MLRHQFVAFPACRAHLVGDRQGLRRMIADAAGAWPEQPPTTAHSWFNLVRLRAEARAARAAAGTPDHGVDEDEV